MSPEERIQRLTEALKDLRTVARYYHKGEAPGDLDACENPDCCGHCKVMRAAAEALGEKG